MFNRMTHYVNSNNILHMKQFGFRENHSTQHATTFINGFKENVYTLSLFIDLRKAFDTVDHKILLKQLHKMGFECNILMWFESYLSHRTQYVSLNGKNSTKLPITQGMLQGGCSPPNYFYT